MEQAEFDGLLEGSKGDIYKMVQMAQYECFKSDLYDHREDISRYGTLDQLRDMGVYAIRESLADEILNDLSYDEDYAPTDNAKDTIISAIYATFEEKYGEDFADCADNFIQDNDDIAGRVNPCAMSVETVRAVNEKGYDAVFAEQWKAELSECDIDPEAVSVDSEAHDMENGRDGLDDNAPEKDADLDGLEAHGFAYPLSTQAATDWLEGDDLAKVNAFLKETCKEVFGILPGADDGGYSLSGEAREAALSRFALPENRKAALDVIRKLNESRDSNENAL